MISRRFFLLVAIGLTTVVSAAAGRASAEGQTVISGGGIPQPLTLAQADETALFQRISLPPLLDEDQSPSGPSYGIKSPYWPRVLPGNGKDRPPAIEEAVYYPQGGFVRASQGGKDAWLALDLRQRAILNRYLDLGVKGLLPAEPGVLQVLTAAASAGEQIGVQAGTRNLTEAQRQAVWKSLAGIVPSQLAAGRQQPDEVPTSDAWLIFILPEGRDVRLYYDHAANLLIDFEGRQSYGVTEAWLPKMLGPDAATGSASYAPGAVPQEKGPGRPVWWLVMVGGGLALVVGAVFLSRGWARQKAGS